MKLKCWLAIAGLSIAHVDAASPESISGLLYNESSGAISERQTRRVLLLQPDGTYRGLYISVYGNPEVGPRSAGIPENGTWSYRRTSENNGELTLDGSVLLLGFVTAGAGFSPPVVSSIPSPTRF